MSIKGACTGLLIGCLLYVSAYSQETPFVSEYAEFMPLAVEVRNSFIKDGFPFGKCLYTVLCSDGCDELSVEIEAIGDDGYTASSLSHSDYRKLAGPDFPGVIAMTLAEIKNRKVFDAFWSLVELEDSSVGIKVTTTLERRDESFSIRHG